MKVLRIYNHYLISDYNRSSFVARIVVGGSICSDCVGALESVEGGLVIERARNYLCGRVHAR